MNVVVLGDVGNSEQHTGDEAMFEVALAELTARGADSFTVIAPATVPGVRQKVRMVKPIGFDRQVGSAYDDNREQRLELVLTLETSDIDIARLSEAVAAADAVVIAGGGNLSASWPHHLYERVALLELAARHGVPSVVCGQTIGPVLTRRQRTRLGHALAGARFVGARDFPSFLLLSEISAGSNAAQQVDDAITLADGPIDESLPPRYVALCVHQYDEDRVRVVREVAALIVDLHRLSELPIAMFPNTGPDQQLAYEVAAMVADSSVICVASLTTAATTASGIRRSAALVSTRFHPLVFALAGGVPCMAITSEKYTAIKLGGALHHAGLADWQVPTDALITPIVAELFGELWSRRAEITTHLRMITPEWFERHRQRWDAIWSAISSDRSAMASLSAQRAVGVSELPPGLAAATWSTALVAAARERLAQADYRFDTCEESAFSLDRTLQSRDEEIENLRTYVKALETQPATIEERPGGRRRRG